MTYRRRYRIIGAGDRELSLRRRFWREWRGAIGQSDGPARPAASKLVQERPSRSSSVPAGSIASQLIPQCPSRSRSVGKNAPLQPTSASQYVLTYHVLQHPIVTHHNLQRPASEKDPAAAYPVPP